MFLFMGKVNKTFQEGKIFEYFCVHPHRRELMGWKSPSIGGILFREWKPRVNQKQDVRRYSPLYHSSAGGNVADHWFLLSLSSASFPRFQLDILEKYPATLVIPSTFSEPQWGQKSLIPRDVLLQSRQVVNSGENTTCRFCVSLKTFVINLAKASLSGFISPRDIQVAAFPSIKGWMSPSIIALSNGSVEEDTARNVELV